MNSAALPLSRSTNVWTKSNPNHPIIGKEDKQLMLQPFRALAHEVVRQGNFVLSGEREWTDGNKTLFFLKNTRENLHIRHESVREYLLLVASHESTGKSFLASFHFPVQRGNRFTQKVTPLFMQQMQGDELRQNALRQIRNYESARVDLYRKLEGFGTVKATEELEEEIRFMVLDMMQRQHGKAGFGQRSMISHIKTFDNLLALERHGRTHNLLSLFNAVTSLTTHHLDHTEPANAEGIGADINKKIFGILERELESAWAEMV
jgi:hypothetical protein